MGVAPRPRRLVRPAHLASDLRATLRFTRGVDDYVGLDAGRYRRFWIRRSSSERRRDFNPPDLSTAQRTLRACWLLGVRLQR